MLIASASIYRGRGGYWSLSALECDANEAGGHLLDKGGGGDGELEEEEGLGARVELDGKGDVPAAVAEECSSDLAAEGGRGGGDGSGIIRRDGEPLACWEDGLEGEDVEE